MIECLKNLIKAQLEFKNVILHITHYYSVLADGTVSISLPLLFNVVTEREFLFVGLHTVGLDFRIAEILFFLKNFY